MENDRIITEAQTWAVRFIGNAAEKFVELGGTDQLSRWSFIVNVQENTERTESELVDEVRSLGVTKIHEDCKRDGIEIPLSVLQQFNNHESLEATRK